MAYLSVQIKCTTVLYHRVKRWEKHCRAKKDLATTRREVSTMGLTAAFDVSLLDSARDINTLGLPAGMI